MQHLNKLGVNLLKLQLALLRLATQVLYLTHDPRQLSRDRVKPSDRGSDHSLEGRKDLAVERHRQEVEV